MINVEERDIDGNLISEINFTFDQKRCNINLDESVISLDGSFGGRGERPSSVHCTSNISSTGIGTKKSDSYFTLIGLHNTSGKIGSLHL